MSAICGSIIPRVAAGVAGIDRKGAAQAFDDRCIAEQLGHARAVDGRRHDEELQILAQTLLRVAGKRKTEIGVERTLMELVEQNRGHAIEHWVVEDHPGKDAFGDDFDARFARYFRAEANPQSDRLADALATRLRHALGGGARREPAWLQHEDAAVFRPRLVRQHQRNPRGLAGAGRRHQDGGIAGAQGRAKVRQGGIDRQRGIVHSLCPDP